MLNAEPAMPHDSSLLHFIASLTQGANALLQWLVTYAIHSTLLIGGVLLMTATSRGRRLVAGHGTWLWRFALVGALVTASLQSMRTAAPLAGTLRLDGDAPARTMVRLEVDRVRTVPSGDAVSSRPTGDTVVRSSITIS